MVILAAAAFAVQSTYQKTKEKIPGQLVFGRYMIPWRYIRQRKQTQINKYLYCENTTRIDHGYRVREKVTTKMRSASKR